MNRRVVVGLAVLAALLTATSAQARIKLVALPEREATIVRLDNPVFTLVEEERTLTLQTGASTLTRTRSGSKCWTTRRR